VGRPFGPGTIQPKGWPAPGERVTCVTCHDIRGAGHEVPLPADNRHFLRGLPMDRAHHRRAIDTENPLLAFCGACHVGPLRSSGTTRM